MTPDTEPLPDDIDALRAALVAERTARHEAEARATGAEAMIVHLKLMIARLQRDRFGPTSERSRRLLDQLELQLEELEANASEDEAGQPEPVGDARRSMPRARPVRGPLPAHLPRERVVIAGPTTCPCCSGPLARLGESVTETLEVIPRQWKVIQTVREKLYRPRLMRHPEGAYAASAAGESRAWRAAAGVRYPSRWTSQVVL